MKIAMSSTNALRLHLKMCKLVVESSAEESTSWGDLYKLLPQLRHALACTVCGSIIENPIGPADQLCQHHVCSGCKGGKKRLKPSCSYCKDYQMYVPNKQLELIVEAFRRTCQYLQQTHIYEKLNSFSLNGGKSSLVELIQEGSGCESPGNQLPDTSEVCKPYMHVSKEEEDSEHSSNEGMSYHANIHISSSMSAPVTSSHQTTPQPTLESHPIHQPSPVVCFAQQAIISHAPSSPSPPLPSAFHVSHPVYGRLFSEGGSISRLKSMSVESASFRSGAVITSQSLSQNGEAVNGRFIPQVNGSRTIKKKTPRGCRCGNATPTPGKLTCCGQRCPCYVESRACVNCRCRGCRNSHRPGGKKVNHHVPTSDIKQEVQPAVSPAPLSQSPVLHQPPPVQLVPAQAPVTLHAHTTGAVQQFHPQQQLYQMPSASPVHHVSQQQVEPHHLHQPVQTESPPQHVSDLPVEMSPHQEVDVKKMIPDVVKLEMPSHASPMRIDSPHPHTTSVQIDSAHFSSAQLHLDAPHHQPAHLPPIHQVIHMPHQIFQAPVFFNTVPVTAISSNVFMTDSPQSSDSIEV